MLRLFDLAHNFLGNLLKKISNLNFASIQIYFDYEIKKNIFFTKLFKIIIIRGDYGLTKCGT